MSQKIIFSLIAILGLNLFFATSTSAEEGIMLISETEGTPITTSDDTHTAAEGVINLEDIDDSSEPTTIINLEPTPDDSFSTNSELENDLIHNGTSDEPLVVCADTNEPGCEDEALDPEMWPLYLSLGALGATILLVIIINLFGRCKK